VTAADYLDLAGSFLESHGASHTAREIAQQPEAWRQTQKLLDAERERIERFLAPLLAIKDLRVILTGAGSSAYIGQCLAPTLLRLTGKRVEAIATTDLVAAPRTYLQQDVPTLLVSFARSGSSPESVAAVELANQCLARCQHLVITCNREGELYRRAQGKESRLALALPDLTHDQGFAMTSSFSSMYYAALAMFCVIEHYAGRVEAIAGSARNVIEQHNAALRALAAQDPARVVFLGSGALAGLAAEAALKLLELSDGAVVTMANTPLGFRHGPKTIVNAATLVVVFVSNDRQTRRYELDLLAELHGDGVGAVLAVNAGIPALAKTGDSLRLAEMSDAADAELLLPYAVIAQLYAFHRSLRLGRRPDTPCASGRVNRVVKGVTIHPL
jgi:tagatose-6-phosphate ketose/aldose isomerase